MKKDVEGEGLLLTQEGLQFGRRKGKVEKFLVRCIHCLWHGETASGKAVTLLVHTRRTRSLELRLQRTPQKLGHE